MAIDFPNSPTNAQIFTSGNKSWIWDGTAWKAYGASLSPTVLKVDTTNSRVGINNQSPTTALDVTGAVTVSGDMTVDTNTLKVDSTNNRVGIVTTSPAYPLDVTGTVQATQHLQGTDYLSPYNGFRNAIINGDFRINQRAWSSSTTDTTYGFDRWKFFRSGGTVTNSAQSFAPNSPAATGYESPSYLRTVVSGHSASSDYAHVGQNIEDVRTFANSQITISFWARCVPAGGESSTPSISVELQTNYGSPGGSSGVLKYFGKTAITTSWARYSITGTVPSLSGKTIGTTANTSSLMIALWYSAGANFNSRTGSLGVQNNTFDIWGVQVERGSVATPFEQRPIGTELALCQRYYWRLSGVASISLRVPSCGGGSSGGAFWQGPVFHPVPMRIGPTALEASGVGFTDNISFDSTAFTSMGLAPQVSPLTSVIYGNGATGGGLSSGYNLLLVGQATAYFALSAEF